MASRLWSLSDWFTRRNRPTPGNRKYVDLIYREISLYATYRPFQANQVSVGDFGELEKDSGEFVYRGNIYKDQAILSELPELTEEAYQPKEGEAIDDWIILARVAHQSDASLSPQANVAGVLGFSIDMEVTFKEGKRGAFLAMKRPRMTELPKEVLLEKLSRVSELRKPRTYLVTGVVSCPAYALEISDKGGKKARVRFAGQLPVPAAPGLAAGGAVGFGWQSEYAGSSHQDACNSNGEDIYCPLYHLKQVRQQRYRQPQSAIAGDDAWTDASPPWDSLDEDGNEIPPGDEEDDE